MFSGCVNLQRGDKCIVFFKKIAAFFSIALLICLLASCGGGGGGATLYNSDEGPHNGGGTDWGAGNNTTDNNNGRNNGSSSSRVRITGGTSLPVDRYVYKGQSYATAQELIEILTLEENLPNETLIEVYVPGESTPRKAKYVKTSSGSAVLRHPYALTIKSDTGGILYDSAAASPPEYFYSNEGFSMSKLTAPTAAQQLIDGETINFPYVWKTSNNQTILPTGSLYGFEENAVIVLSSEIQKYTVQEFNGYQTLFISSNRTAGEEIVIPAGTPAFTMIKSASTGTQFKLDLKNATINDITDARISSWTTGIVANLLAADITEIKLPDYITAFGNSAFSGWPNLANIELPANITSIGDYAFNSCGALAEIQIPASVTSIGDSAFNGCSALAEIQIPASVTSIGSSAFQSCSSLSEVTVPCNVLDGFKNVNAITKMTVIKSETSSSIDANAYSHSESNSMRLSELIIAEGIITIGQNAFKNLSNLQILSIPSSVTKIFTGAFASAFANCNLNVTFNSSKNQIEYSARTMQALDRGIFERDYNNGHTKQAYATFTDQNAQWDNSTYDWTAL
ncbi:MAG: leucine-rich repeat domain-containing protein [Treponemataceae bacterium]|nr:leucine-rich repeat domain-containing protein [Treponemataceae bacterium]